MGDPSESYPAGIFCIIDDKPRKSFSQADRDHLEEIADLAGAEIMRCSQEASAVKKIELNTKREAWKKSKLVRCVSEKSGLETADEVMTPPTSREMAQIEAGMSSLGMAVEKGMETRPAPASSIASGSTEGRRLTLAETASGSDASQDMGVTDEPPTYGRRKGGTGVHAGPHRLSPDIKSVLDLSTQLVGDSLDLDFCCRSR
jgi:hypothetical protein